MKNKATKIDAKPIPVALLAGIGGSIALAIVLIVLAGFIFLRQKPKVVVQNKSPENKALQKSAVDRETKTRIPVVRVKDSEKKVIEKEKKGIFTLSFLESKIQTDQKTERLPLGPLVFVDKVDSSVVEASHQLAEYVQPQRELEGIALGTKKS